MKENETILLYGDVDKLLSFFPEGEVASNLKEDLREDVALLVTTKDCESISKIIRTNTEGNISTPLLYVANENSERCWNCGERYGCVNRLKGSTIALETISHSDLPYPIASLVRGSREAPMSFESMLDIEM